MNTKETFRFLFRKNYGVYTSLLLPILFAIKAQSLGMFFLFFNFWLLLMTMYMLLVCFVNQIKDKKVITILSGIAALAVINAGVVIYLFA